MDIDNINVPIPLDGGQVHVCTLIDNSWHEWIRTWDRSYGPVVRGMLVSMPDPGEPCTCCGKVLWPAFTRYLKLYWTY